MKRKVFKTITKPTDIVIYGDCLEKGFSADIYITDDESSYTMMIDGKLPTGNVGEYCSALGFINVMTFDEYRNEMEDLSQEFLYDGPVESYLLRNFTGEIAIRLAIDCLFVELDKVDFSMCLEEQASDLVDGAEDEEFDVNIILDLPKCQPELIDKGLYDSLIKIENRRLISKNIVENGYNKE